MKKLLALCLITAAACGMKSSQNEAVGQVKKVVNKTPIICPDYVEADISLGIVRNGVGSMSHEDMEVAVDPEDYKTIALLKKAAETSAIVKFTYDVKRISPCWPDHRLATFEIETVPPAGAKP